MPYNLQTVTEKSFRVTWQLPSYSGSSLVACGADIPALHCWQQAEDRILIYGKVELTACYESKEKPNRFHFASAVRYLHLQITTQQTIETESDIKANLAASPSCSILSGQEQKNEVQVEGVIRLTTPAVQERVIMRKMEAEQISAPVENQLVDRTSLRLEVDQAQDKESLPNSTESVPDQRQRVPYFPRGAESIPPVIWSMPERG